MKNTFCITEHRAINSLDYIYQARKNIETINNLLKKGLLDEGTSRSYEEINHDTRIVSRNGIRISA